MYGTYSFINVIGGREEKDDDGHSRRNMVEVAIVLKILRNRYKGMSIWIPTLICPSQGFILVFIIY